MTEQEKFHLLIGAGNGVGITTEEGENEEPEGDAGEPNGEDGDNDQGTDDGGADEGDKAGSKPKGDDTDWKAQARRHENEKKATAKQLEAIKKALGLSKDSKLSPEELQEKLSEADTDRADTKRENMVLRHAAKLGVDGDDLMDSRKFMNKLKELDMDDANYSDKVKALVTAESKGSKKSAGTPKGAAPLDGKPAGTQLTRADLKKMSPDEIVKAQEKGLLKDLLGG
jgi:hypothetical protein